MKSTWSSSLETLNDTNTRRAVAMSENPEKPALRKNSIIQVNQNQASRGLNKALMQVCDIRDWGVIGCMIIPLKGIAYFRVNFGDFDHVGEPICTDNLPYE